MRRKDKEITDAAMLKTILKSAKYVTLALSMNDQPYLVSLSHGYDENNNCLYFHCAMEGKKLVYLKSNNKVWGQALKDYGYAQGKCLHLYATVHFSGTVTFIEDPGDKRQAMECMMRHLDNEPEVLIARLNEERLLNTVIGKVAINSISGKKSQEVSF